MMSNAYFLAKIRLDTAENEPAKNLQNKNSSAKFGHFANFADPNSEDSRGRYTPYSVSDSPPLYAARLSFLARIDIIPAVENALLDAIHVAFSPAVRRAKRVLVHDRNEIVIQRRDSSDAVVYAVLSVFSELEIAELATVDIVLGDLERPVTISPFCDSVLCVIDRF